MNPSSSNNMEKNMDDYIPLCRAIHIGDWEKAQEFFKEDEDALMAKLDEEGNTALHLAIRNSKNIWIFENLLELINPESLPSIVNNYHQPPLHYAAMIDNYLLAKKLVDKNPHLLFVCDNNNTLPIHRSIVNPNRDTFLYLLKMCKQHIGLTRYGNPFVGEHGLQLLNHTITAGFFDVVSEMLNDYPELASTLSRGNQTEPLWNLARKWDAYPSGERYNFYQRFVYSHVPAKNYKLDKTYKINDIENQETHKQTLVTKSYIYPVMKRIYVMFWKVSVLHVPHVKQLHEDKVKHKKVLAILKFMCDEVGKLKSNHRAHLYGAFNEAMHNNTPEVIEHITRIFPDLIIAKDYSGYSLAQVSIMNRCENVYNFLVHEMAHDKYFHNVCADNDANNLLHLAAKLAPIDKLNMVSGAALQMQRELQWFQEVSNYVGPEEKNLYNLNHEKPLLLFRKEHEDLRQKGEEWMKKTADSYTITAALIITIVFAGAITVPGGNNGDSGKAIYETKLSFIIFVVSDAISLFTSTTSLLLFLSILTARFAEDDFLYKLPKRLILGLVMLFMSVTTMMIAFSAALYIIFGEQMSWILIPIAGLTCLPIASFVTLQLPLLVDLVSSTYGLGIFGKRIKLY